MFEGFFGSRTFDHFSNPIVFFFVYLWGWGERNTSINIVLSLHSPECNVKATTDYCSQSTAHYSFWPCWFVSCKTAALELVVLIRYLQAECKYANPRNCLSAFRQMKSELLWACSLCIFTTVELVPYSPSFFGLYPEISLFSTPPDIPQLFLSSFSTLTSPSWFFTPSGFSELFWTSCVLPSSPEHALRFVTYGMKEEITTEL